MYPTVYDLLSQEAHRIYDRRTVHKKQWGSLGEYAAKFISELNSKKQINIPSILCLTHKHSSHCQLVFMEIYFKSNFNFNASLYSGWQTYYISFPLLFQNMNLEGSCL